MGQLLAAAVTVAVARRGKQGRQGAVLIQTVQKGDDDRKGATAEQIATDGPVFIAKDEHGNQDPKGTISLRTTIHKKPPVFCRRICRLIFCFPAGFVIFYYIIFSIKRKMFYLFSSYAPSKWLPKQKKKGIMVSGSQANTLLGFDRKGGQRLFFLTRVSQRELDGGIFMKKYRFFTAQNVATKAVGKRIKK